MRGVQPTHYPQKSDASQHHLVPKVTKERNSMTAKTRFIHKFYKVYYFSQLPDIPVATQFERMRVPKIEEVVDLLIKPEERDGDIKGILDSLAVVFARVNKFCEELIKLQFAVNLILFSKDVGSCYK